METGVPKPQPIDTPVADSAQVRGLPEEKDASAFVASQWKLMWWRFRKHRLAMISGVIIIFIYLVAIFAEFFAPLPPDQTSTQMTYAPPQTLVLFDESGFNPHVFGYKSEIDPVALRRTFTIDPETKVPVRLFVQGYEYKLLGLIDANLHLVGPADPSQPMYLLGADRLGRDVLSRLVHGTRISMSIGLVGVTISLMLGIILGGISGYYGGAMDNVIQRVIEFIRSLPTIPLWLGLGAALPVGWGPLQIYFAITVILSFIGWTGLARVVRGRFLTLREEDFVIAARLDGASQRKIMFQHMLPAFYSHIIASVTLAIPGMILAETSLSFLGLGLRPPIVSWGVLLQEAQNVRSVATAPWLLVPAVAVVVAVLALNFLGDGLRDAADPYA
ncbi:MAG: peptide ABC transporter permease [Anaerolineaceae bacterium]|nr:peptide ABC transporter permease [Anaerolineaceae bacterium]